MIEGKCKASSQPVLNCGSASKDLQECWFGYCYLFTLHDTAFKGMTLHQKFGKSVVPAASAWLELSVKSYIPMVLFGRILGFRQGLHVERGSPSSFCISRMLQADDFLQHLWS